MSQAQLPSPSRCRVSHDATEPLQPETLACTRHQSHAHNNRTTTINHRVSRHIGIPRASADGGLRAPIYPVASYCQTTPLRAATHPAHEPHTKHRPRAEHCPRERTRGHQSPSAPRARSFQQHVRPLPGRDGSYHSNLAHLPSRGLARQCCIGCGCCTIPGCGCCTIPGCGCCAPPGAAGIV